MHRPDGSTPPLRPARGAQMLFAALFLGSGCGGGISSLEKRAEALIQRDLAGQAIQMVRAELDKSPENARLLALLGRAKLASGDIAGADSAYGRACAVDTSFFAPYVSTFIAQGRILVEAGRWGEASECFRIALARDPSAGGRIAAALTGAGAKLLADRPGEADQAFDAAHARDSSSRVGIARAYLDFGRRQLAERPADAAENLERALAWDPALGEEIGAAIGDVMTRGGNDALAALVPLAARLGGGGRKRFASTVSGRKHSLTVTVAGRAGWIRTAFDLAAGDTIVLEPAGEVRAEAARDGWISEPCGPRGWTAKSMSWWEGEGGRLLAPGFPRMALVARVAGGAPFAVPERRAWVATAPGTLELAVNDVSQRAADGAGSFTVRLDGPVSAYRPAGAGATAAEGR